MAVTAVRFLEYLDQSGLSPWRRWFNDLDAHAAAIGAAHGAWADYKQRKKGAA